MTQSQSWPSCQDARVEKIWQRPRELPNLRYLWSCPLRKSLPGPRLSMLEKEMAAHSSILAWRIPWAEEPGRLQSRGSQRVGHDWSDFTCAFGEGNGNPLQCSCLENPRDGGAWWAAVYGVSLSGTRLKLLSNSSSIVFNYWKNNNVSLKQYERRLI